MKVVRYPSNPPEVIGTCDGTVEAWGTSLVALRFPFERDVEWRIGTLMTGVDGSGRPITERVLLAEADGPPLDLLRGWVPTAPP